MIKLLVVRRSAAWLLALGLAGGCHSSTPVGSVECIGEEIRCGMELSYLENPTIGDPISSRNLEALQAAWSGEVFEKDWPADLVADENGELWTANAEGRQVVLAKLDREGATVQENTIVAPEGIPMRARYRPRIGSFAAAAPNTRATLVLIWERECDGSDEASAPCQFMDMMSFDGFATAPKRYPATTIGGVVLSDGSAQWNHVGSPAIDKYDAKGGLVWRQTGLLALTTGTTWYVWGAAHSKGHVGALVWPMLLGLQSVQLWKLDPFGNIAQASTISDLEGDDLAYAVDVADRDVIAGSDRSGDLMLLRVTAAGDSETARLQREEYTTLRAHGLALDSKGAAYVVTTAGDRDDLRGVLCQLPDSGSMRCFNLGSFPRYVHAFVVSEPGVVYIQLGTELRRYELPGR